MQLTSSYRLFWKVSALRPTLGVTRLTYVWSYRSLHVCLSSCLSAGVWWGESDGPSLTRWKDLCIFDFTCTGLCCLRSTAVHGWISSVYRIAVRCVVSSIDCLGLYLLAWHHISMHCPSIYYVISVIIKCMEAAQVIYISLLRRLSHKYTRLDILSLHYVNHAEYNHTTSKISS